MEVDPIGLKYQIGLEIVETGYAVMHLSTGGVPSAITLNGVEMTQDLGPKTLEGEEFF